MIATSPETSRIVQPWDESPWTVYRGKCEDTLPAFPAGTFQHVITDPPYEAQAHTKARRVRKNPVEGGGIAEEYEIDFSPITEKLRNTVCHEYKRLCSGWVLIFCQIEAIDPWKKSMERAGIKWIRGQVWVKPDGSPQFTGDRPAQGVECIATGWAGKGRLRWNGGGSRGVYTHNVNGTGAKAKRPDHPTPKPIPLMIELFEKFTDPGDLVLDTFAGSGQHGIAAIRTGRRIVMIEEQSKYYEMIRSRCSEEMPQPGSNHFAPKQPCLF